MVLLKNSVDEKKAEGMKKDKRKAVLQISVGKNQSSLKGNKEYL